MDAPEASRTEVFEAGARADMAWWEVQKNFDAQQQACNTNTGLRQGCTNQVHKRYICMHKWNEQDGGVVERCGADPARAVERSSWRSLPGPLPW